jgi:hypothetical protein
MDLVEASSLTLVRHNRSIGSLVPKNKLSDVDFIKSLSPDQRYRTRSLIQEKLKELLPKSKIYGQKMKCEEEAKKLGIHLIEVIVDVFTVDVLQNVTFDWPLFDCYQNTLICVLHQANLGIISYEIQWIQGALVGENHNSNSNDILNRFTYER